MPRCTPALVIVLTLLLAGCGEIGGLGSGDGGGPVGRDDATDRVVLARATWDTGWFAAEIHRQLISELGHDVTDPAEQTLDANRFYPALARGDVDLWANGWFPLHEGYLTRTLFTGQERDINVSAVGTQVASGALQGFLIDAATADEHGITSMADLADPQIAARFDDDGDGVADLIGCDEGWGCHDAIDERLDTARWGDRVHQISGDYGELVRSAIDDIEAGESTLFYTWTPNWTVHVLTPGEDVVWLEDHPVEDGASAVEDLEGCAAELPCELGWVANDIRAVANDDFLNAYPDIARLLEQITIPLGDIAAQNAEMVEASGYGPDELTADAEEWIAANRDTVDGWLEEARAAAE